MASLVAFTSAVFFSVLTPVTTYMTGDPRMVTESPTLGDLVVMPIVSHRPTFGATPVGFIVPIPSRTTVMPTIRPLR
jgi:hypothetical protein